MAQSKKQSPPEVSPEVPSLRTEIVRTYDAVRAARIREIRARDPKASYSVIARLVGCCEKTVGRVLTGKTHAGAEAE